MMGACSLPPKHWATQTTAVRTQFDDRAGPVPFTAHRYAHCPRRASRCGVRQPSTNDHGGVAAGGNDHLRDSDRRVADAGPEAAWILVWWVLDLLSGGSTSVGRISRSVRIPLLAAVVVTGAVAVIATFTSWEKLVPAEAIASEGPAVFLIALWWTAGATAVIRAVIPMVLPKRTLRIVSESLGSVDKAVSEVVVSGSARTDSDAFVAAVLAEVRRRDVELVELSFGIDAEMLRRLSWELRNRDVELYFPLFDLGVDPARVRAMSATDSSGLLIAPSRPGVLDRVAKRAFDVVAASLLVLIFLPLLVAVAVGIKLSMPGPVFFSQQRVGRESRPFRIFKFRSMVINADAQLTDLLKTQGTATQPLFKVDSDPRITRLGHVLRKSSIDELPQLFNVICGSMSLVGPRPQREERSPSTEAPIISVWV